MASPTSARLLLFSSCSGFLFLFFPSSSYFLNTPHSFLPEGFTLEFHSAWKPLPQIFSPANSPTYNRFPVPLHIILPYFQDSTYHCVKSSCSFVYLFLMFIVYLRLKSTAALSQKIYLSHARLESYHQRHFLLQIYFLNE